MRKYVKCTNPGAESGKEGSAPLQPVRLAAESIPGAPGAGRAEVLLMGPTRGVDWVELTPGGADPG